MPLDPQLKSLHDHLKSTGTGVTKLKLVLSCATVAAAVVALHDQHPGTYAKACEFLEADPETAYAEARKSEDERLEQAKRRREFELKRAEDDQARAKAERERAEADAAKAKAERERAEKAKGKGGDGPKDTPKDEQKSGGGPDKNG